MSWTCSHCGRTFRNRNQLHQCSTLPVGFHLQKASRELLTVYETLMEKVTQFGPFELHANRSEILLRKTAAFLSIRILKTKIQLVFYLDHLDQDPPVNKVYDVSKRRIIHQAEISSSEEINPRLLFLLIQAYDLID